MAEKTIEQPQDDNKPIYLAFIEFTAIPLQLRNDDMRTIDDFAKFHNIDRRTLFYWKKGDNFWNDVKAFYEKAKDRRLNAVRSSLLKSAMDGDTSAIKLYLQYEEAWSEKIENKLSGNLNVTDYLKAKRSLSNGDNGTGKNT